MKTIDQAVSISGFDADGIDFRGVTSATCSGDFDDDYVVIGVNTKDVKGVSGAKLATAKEAGSTYYENAVYFLNNDTDKDVIAVFIDTSGKMYDADGTAQVQNATSINSIAVSLTAPTKGAPISTSTSGITSTAGVKVNSIKWINTATNEEATGTFDASTAYKAEIQVSAKDGYALASAITVTATGSVSAIYANGVITVTFAATEA